MILFLHLYDLLLTASGPTVAERNGIVELRGTVPEAVGKSHHWQPFEYDHGRG